MDFSYFTSNPRIDLVPSPSRRVRRHQETRDGAGIRGVRARERRLPMGPLYLIGSLRNEGIPTLSATLREVGFDIFDDWFAAGPIADDSWMSYEKGKGVSYGQALKGYAARHVFEFDQYHLNRSVGGILALPAGKSGHLELGYLCGQGKPCFVLYDKEPDRWDVMYQFATGGLFFDVKDLINAMLEYKWS